MLRLLRRIFGWDADSGPFDFDCLEQPVRPTSSTASTLAKGAAQPASQPVPTARASAPKDAPASPSQPRPSQEKTANEILDNPELSLNGPQDEGFDPYNTGAFNRSSSWEKIAKHRTNR